MKLLCRVISGKSYNFYKKKQPVFTGCHSTILTFLADCFFESNIAKLHSPFFPFFVSNSKSILILKNYLIFSFQKRIVNTYTENTLQYPTTISKIFLKKKTTVKYECYLNTKSAVFGLLPML